MNTMGLRANAPSKERSAPGSRISEKSETPLPIGSLRERFLSALARNRGESDWAALALGPRMMPGCSGNSRSFGQNRRNGLNDNPEVVCV